MSSTSVSAAKRTVLYETHLSLGARMVPFAGWEMPLQYPSGPIEEHRLVRRSAGLFDTCHMGRLRVRGAGSSDFLDRLLTAKLNDLPPGFSRYSLMLREDGGVLDDVFVYRLAREDWLLVVNAANAEKDKAWIQARLSRPEEGWVTHVILEDLSPSLGMIAFQGPRALEALSRLLLSAEGGPWTPPERFGWSWAWVPALSSPEGFSTTSPPQERTAVAESTIPPAPGGNPAPANYPAAPGGYPVAIPGRLEPPPGPRGAIPCLIGRTGYTGEDGVELFPPWEDTPAVWDSILKEAGTLGIEVGPAGLASRDSLRFEPGFALYGHELSEEVTPVEAGLLWACDLEKPFIGREAVLRGKQEGPKEKLVSFLMEEQGVPRAGYEVADEDGRTVGRVVTGLYAPTLDAFAGNAFVSPDLAGSGKTLYIVIRGSRKKARVAKRPLYKPAYRA